MDLSEVARVYGADLGSLETRPLGIEEAKAVFHEQCVPVCMLMLASGGFVRQCLPDDVGMTPVPFWEVFAGSCNLTKAIVEKCQSPPAPGGQHAAVLPPVESQENELSSTTWKVLPFMESAAALPSPPLLSVFYNF